MNVESPNLQIVQVIPNLVGLFFRFNEGQRLMKLNRSVLPNVQILDLANSYYEAAKILTDAGANAIPVVNLRCHAIELFLKSLHLTDTATDVGDGVFLLTPSSGRDAGHNLTTSFGKALQVHREALLSGMPDFLEELQLLEGIFQRSRYLYENQDGLPLSKATSVSTVLAENIKTLPRLAVKNN